MNSDVVWLHDTSNQRIPMFMGDVSTKAQSGITKYFGFETKAMLHSTRDVYSMRACYSKRDIQAGAEAVKKKKPSLLKKDFDDLSKKLLLIARTASKDVKGYFILIKGYIEFLSIAYIPELSIQILEKTNKNDLLPSFLDEAALRAKKLSDEELEQEYWWIKNNYVDTKKATAAEIRSILVNRKPKKQQVKESFISVIGYIQDYRKRVFMETSYYLNNILKSIGEKYALTLEEMFLLRPQEIIKGEIPTTKTFEDRKIRTLFFYNGKLNFYQGAEAVKKEEELAPIEFNLSGTVAYPGNLSGIVRLVLSINELNKLKDGEILVTSNTTPDYVPYLKKVKAIITEKGGITSHASVISREMKIPCVVGVRNITGKVKSGDKIKIKNGEIIL